MAIYHMQAQIISRKAGRSSTAAAAYRAGDRIEDERTGLVHDYTRKRGIEHAEVLAPHGLTLERSQLWNAVELKNKRLAARVAREFEVALPAELNSEQRKELALKFSRHLVDRYNVAADVCIHAPHAKGDDRNHHAHILTTDNTINPDGSLGNKARELDGVARTMAGDRQNAIDELRELWGQMANEALERAGRQERIDHRSLADQGIEREATIHLGPVVVQMERREKEVAEREGRAARIVSDRMAVNAGIVHENEQRERRRVERSRRTAEPSRDIRPIAKPIPEQKPQRAWVDLLGDSNGERSRLTEAQAKKLLARLREDEKRQIEFAQMRSYGLVIRLRNGEEIIDEESRVSGIGSAESARIAAAICRAKGWEKVEIHGNGQHAESLARALRREGFREDQITGETEEVRQPMRRAFELERIREAAAGLRETRGMVREVLARDGLVMSDTKRDAIGAKLRQRDRLREQLMSGQKEPPNKAEIIRQSVVEPLRRDVDQVAFEIRQIEAKTLRLARVFSNESRLLQKRHRVLDTLLREASELAEAGVIHERAPESYQQNAQAELKRQNRLHQAYEEARTQLDESREESERSADQMRADDRTVDEKIEEVFGRQALRELEKRDRGMSR